MKQGKCDDRGILEGLLARGTLSLTPTASYDDRFVLHYAQTCGGIVVSNDQYRDISHESPEMHEIATKRKLGFTWAKNACIFPVDPLGRNGPTIDQFLKF